MEDQLPRLGYRDRSVFLERKSMNHYLNCVFALFLAVGTSASTFAQTSPYKILDNDSVVLTVTLDIALLELDLQTKIAIPFSDLALLGTVGSSGGSLAFVQDDDDDEDELTKCFRLHPEPVKKMANQTRTTTVDVNSGKTIYEAAGTNTLREKVMVMCLLPVVQYNLEATGKPRKVGFGSLGIRVSQKHAPHWDRQKKRKGTAMTTSTPIPQFQRKIMGLKV